MCFKRNPTLGHYNGSRPAWYFAYRQARINARKGRDPNPAFAGIRWKAELIVAHERNAVDYFSTPLVCRIESKRIIDSILAEPNQ